MILTDDHPPRIGGVSVITARIARELHARGHEVTVVARYRRALAPITGTQLATSWGPSFGRWGGVWLAARALPALARADRVLATTWPVATTLCALGIPYLLLGHGSDITCPPRDPALFERVWHAARARLVMSSFLATCLGKRGLTASVLPAPVDIAPEPIRLDHAAPWVLVARGTALKGGDRFVRWLAAARHRGVVVGDGPEIARWSQLARTLGADVRFAGACSESQTREILGMSSLCVLVPRRSPDGCGDEGFGLSLVEAAALGVPSVGARVGGVPSALGPGLLLEDPDDVASSVAAVSAWWHPERGADSHAWCRAKHGVVRCVNAIEGVSS